MPEAGTPARKPARNNALRSRIEGVNERIEAIENDAKGRLSRVFTVSNEKLVDLDRALARMSEEDWSFRGLKKRLDDLRTRADTVRVNALKRVADFPGPAVTALAASSRSPIQNLAQGMQRIAKRLEAAPKKPSGAAAPARGT